jgi:hypothetical protein
MRVRIAIAVVAAVLFAVVPAVQAYCGVELPAGALAPSQAGDQPSFAAETGDPAHSVCCCGDSPDAAVDDRASPEHKAPLVGKAPVASLALAHGKTAAIFAVAPHRARYDLPPPEPMFRRSPRLLL